MLKAELLSIGDELLIGQIVNTNASTLSKKLNAIGIDVHRITTCGDSIRDIRQAVQRAWKESDVVIATGGLGPTHDDISKAVVAKYFDKELLLDKKTLTRVKARFTLHGYKKMPDINIGQAMVPTDFLALPNEWGTAPGLLYHVKGKTFVILPGVPHEMEGLMTYSVIPQLKKLYKGKFGQVIHHRVLLTTGIGESLLAEKIGDVKEFLEEGATLAFLPKTSGLRLRISVRADSEKKAQAISTRIENHLRIRAAGFIFGSENETLEESVVGLLKKTKTTVSTAESCTGGMVAMKITNIPGSSDVFPGGVVSYANEIKTSELGVSKDILKKYGAVSEECAIAMAEGIRKKYDSTYAISETGTAGPDGGTKEKPVGTVWLALAEKGKPTETRLLQNTGSRSIIRERATDAALEMLRRRLIR